MTGTDGHTEDVPSGTTRTPQPVAAEGGSLSRMFAWLPAGGNLPVDSWRRRHNAVLVILWAHIPLLVAFGLYEGLDTWISHAHYRSWGLGLTLTEGGVIALLASIATWPQLSRRVRAVSASVGLITCSAVLTQFSGGFIEAHFHFFVMVGVIAMYVDWIPFLLAVGYVAVHHGVVGTVAPGSVYNHPAAIAHPWNWALIHAFFVLALSSVQVTHWAIQERAGRRTEIVLQSAGDGIAGFDRDGRIAFANPAFATLVGVRADALPGRRIDQTVRLQPPASADSAGAEPWTTGHDGRRRTGTDFVLTRSDGTTMPVDWTCAPVLERGVLAGAVLSLRDVTERARSLQALRKRERQLAEAQRIAHVGSWEWHIRTDRIDWSDEAYRMHGKQAGSFEVTLDDMLFACEPADRERMRKWLADQKQLARNAFLTDHATETTIHSFEYNIRTPAGQARTLVVSGRIAVDDAGEPAMLRGTMQDITERRRTEEDRQVARERLLELEHLKAQDTFKSQFINAAAHELNTPLTPLLVQLRIMEREGVDSWTPRQTEALQILKRNQNRYGRLVRDLLDAARFQAGRFGIEAKEIDLRDILAEAVRSFDGAADEAGVDLALANLTDPLIVEADAERMSQVLFNLLKNALKFTPSGGSIHVSAQPMDGQARVLVRDTGIGMTAAQIEKLFEPFSQVHEPTEERERGSGLGLYLCRTILELHGGHIWCDSGGPDKGSGFTFELPLRTESPIRGHFAESADASLELPS